MDGIDFFQEIAASNRQISFQDFRSQWEKTVSNEPGPNKIIPLFFHAAKVCGREGQRYFDSWKSHDLARETIFNSFKDSFSQPYILNHPFKERQLNQLLGVCRVSGVMPHDKLKETLVRKTKNSLPDADSQSCYQYIKSFSELSIYPGDKWVGVWWESASKSLAGMKNYWLHDIVYQLAMLDCLRRQEKEYKDQLSPCCDIAVRILKIYRDNKDQFFPDRIICQQIQDAALWFDFDLDAEGYNFPYETNSSSRIEEIFRRTFDRLGAKLVDGHKTKSGHLFDISIEFNRKSLAVEIDGSPHMLLEIWSGEKYYDASTRIQTGLIQKILPYELSLVRVPIFYLCDNLKLSVDQIVKAVLNVSSNLNGEPVVMQGLDKFVPISQPDAWKLAV